jgi:hypothetical protein
MSAFQIPFLLRTRNFERLGTRFEGKDTLFAGSKKAFDT